MKVIDKETLAARRESPYGKLTLLYLDADKAGRAAQVEQARAFVNAWDHHGSQCYLQWDLEGAYDEAFAKFLDEKNITGEPRASVYFYGETIPVIAQQSYDDFTAGRPRAEDDLFKMHERLVSEKVAAWREARERREG